MTTTPRSTFRALDMPPLSIVAGDDAAWIKKYDRLSDEDVWIGTPLFALPLTNDFVDAEVAAGRMKVLRYGTGEA